MGGSSPSTDIIRTPEQAWLFQQLQPTLQAGFGGSPYDLPDPTMLQPTQQWYQNLSPEVMAGIRAPYEDAGMQLMETMGFRGMGGSPRGGFSGSAGVAAGKFAEEAARNIGMQAWQMSAPGAQMQYGAELGRNMAPWNAAVGLVPSTFPTAVQNPGQQGFGGPLGMGAGLLAGSLIPGMSALGTMGMGFGGMALGSMFG